MRKTSTTSDLRQEEPKPWRESLDERLRVRMRELIEQVLEEQVEEALGVKASGEKQLLTLQTAGAHDGVGRAARGTCGIRPNVLSTFSTGFGTLPASSLSG